MKGGRKEYGCTMVYISYTAIITVMEDTGKCNKSCPAASCCRLHAVPLILKEGRLAGIPVKPVQVFGECLSLIKWLVQRITVTEENLFTYMAAIISPDENCNSFYQFAFFLKTALCFLLLSGCFAVHAQSLPDNTDTFLNSTSFINWAKAHAFPLQDSDSATSAADLQPLKKMLGRARVVALGEPAHGVHEPIAFRNRLFRFLVENCGFTAIVLEAGLAESKPAADFVAGDGGTAEEAARRLTIGNAAPENIELFKWMRQYNADPAHNTKIKVYGMDMQIRGFPGDTTPSHAALDEALAYLQRVDPSSATAFHSALLPYIHRLSVAGYPSLSRQEHDALTAILCDIAALLERQRIQFIAASSKENYEWGYRNALVARQTDQLARIMPPDQSGKIPPEAWMVMNTRDAAMAENVLWILQNQAQEGKVLVYAHNAHVKNAVTTGGVWNAFAQPPNSTGQYLRSRLGNDLFIVGTSLTPSPASVQPGSFDRALLQVGHPHFMLNLRAAAGDPPAAAWLALPRPMEANTATYLTLVPSIAFDAVVFLGKAARK
jgi:erythromycin esterase